MIRYECFDIKGKSGPYAARVWQSLTPAQAKILDVREHMLRDTAEAEVGDDVVEFEYALCDRQSLRIDVLRQFENPKFVPTLRLVDLPTHDDDALKALEMTRGRVHDLVWQEYNVAISQLDGWLAQLIRHKHGAWLIRKELRRLGEPNTEGEYLIGGPPGTKRAAMANAGALLDLLGMLVADVQTQIADARAELIQHARIFLDKGR
jgi:hypothetical protein